MTAGIIIDIIIIAIILWHVIRGYKKGLSTIVFGLLCTIVAVIVAFILFKPTANILIEKTTIDEYFSDGIYKILNNQNFKDEELINPKDTNMSEQIVEIINKYLSEALQKSADSVFGYVSVKISHLMVNLLTLIFIIIILRIILGFFKIIVDILASLPIIKQLNYSGGMALGLIKGLLLIYIIFAIFSVFSPVVLESGILAMIQESKIGSTLYNNNLILKIISKGI